MSGQHTKGPWRINEDVGWSIVVDPAGVLVARVALDEDARLISVAPDLLAALVDMTERVAGTLPTPGSGSDRAVIRARLAIARATDEAWS